MRISRLSIQNSLSAYPPAPLVSPILPEDAWRSTDLPFLCRASPNTPVASVAGGGGVAGQAKSADFAFPPLPLSFAPAPLSPSSESAPLPLLAPSELTRTSCPLSTSAPHWTRVFGRMSSPPDAAPNPGDAAVCTFPRAAPPLSMPDNPLAAMDGDWPPRCAPRALPRID